MRGASRHAGVQKPAQERAFKAAGAGRSGIGSSPSPSAGKGARLSALDQTEKDDGGGHASQIAEALDEPAAERREEAQGQQRRGAEAAHDGRDVQRNASEIWICSFTVS